MRADVADDLVRWVDPLVGTVGEGNTFPGSCRPFGLVQASPATGERVSCSGYRHTDTTIRGFSQTHLNGTGRPAMGDILLMPFTGDFDESALASPFRKETQVCSPDYYAVTLERGGIRAEATTSPRVAWWRFTWPEGAPKRLLVDAAAMLMQPFNMKFGLRVPSATAETSRKSTCGSTCTAKARYAEGNATDESSDPVRILLRSRGERGACGVRRVGARPAARA